MGLGLRYHTKAAAQQVLGQGPDRGLDLGITGLADDADCREAAGHRVWRRLFPGIGQRKISMVAAASQLYKEKNLPGIVSSHLDSIGSK